MPNPSRRPLIGIPAGTFNPPDARGRPHYRINGNYSYSLAEAGAAPVSVPLDLPEEALRAVFDRLDGFCLAGGVDVDPARYGEERHPALGSVDAARDATEILMAHWALDAGMPILGICRGIQLLNVAGGGSLYQDIAAQVPGAARHNYDLAESPWGRTTQRVRLASGSRLAAVVGASELATNSYHHQAVKETGPAFRAVAWAEDGIVEGIEAPDRPFVVAVQWHPEGMYDTDEAARKLFAAFVDAVQDSMRRRTAGGAEAGDLDLGRESF